MIRHIGWARVVEHALGSHCAQGYKTVTYFHLNLVEDTTHHFGFSLLYESIIVSIYAPL
jgi:hypothetical protein